MCNSDLALFRCSPWAGPSSSMMASAAQGSLADTEVPHIDQEIGHLFLDLFDDGLEGEGKA